MQQADLVDLAMDNNLATEAYPITKIVALFEQVNKESGLGDAAGMMDVNKYTLQHNKYENVFSFGDAVGFNTTRTHNAAIA